MQLFPLRQSLLLGLFPFPQNILFPFTEDTLHILRKDHFALQQQFGQLLQTVGMAAEYPPPPSRRLRQWYF